MLRRAKFLLALGVLVLGFAAAALIVAARPRVERAPVVATPPLVRVVAVTRQPTRLEVESRGSVEPATESTLIAQVAGRIERVAPALEEGAFFRRGEALVWIEDEDYRLAIEGAEASLAQARVRLDLERAEAELARADWDELGGGEAPPLVSRAPQLAEAEAGLKAAAAALEQARLALRRTVVRAPFDGRVRRQSVDVGHFVTPGSPLAEVFAIAAAEIRLPVHQSDLRYLELELGTAGADGGGSGEVTITGEVGGGRETWRGRIVRVGAAIDPRTRMLPLFVEIDDPLAIGRDGAPLPMGLFVEARIPGREVEDAALLPRSALRSDNRVLIVDGDDRLRFRDVEVLRVERDRIVLTGGVETGERVLVSPLETVTEGMAVRPLADDGPPVTAPLVEERL